MLFVLLKGCAKVSIPSTESNHPEAETGLEEIWLTPTKNAVILAMDGGEGCKGHVTEYPSREETHALQIILGKDFDVDHWKEVVGGGWDVVRDGEACDDY